MFVRVCACVCVRVRVIGMYPHVVLGLGCADLYVATRVGEHDHPPVARLQTQCRLRVAAHGRTTTSMPTDLLGLEVVVETIVVLVHAALLLLLLGCHARPG